MPKTITHNTPIETEQFLINLFDLASDAQKEEIAWAIARSEFPTGYIQNTDSITVLY